MAALPLLFILGATSSTATTTAVATTATVSDLYGSRPTRGAVLPGDARGYEVPPGIEPEDAFLFLPRAILFPVEWTLFGVFWPIGKLLWVLEEYAIIEHVVDFLYNDARTAGVLPIFTAFSGSGPSGGLTIFHHDLFGYGESLSLTGKFGNPDHMAYDLSFSADRLGGTHLWVEAQARFELRPGLLYFGIGEERGNETRYSQNRVLGRARIGRTFGDEDERVKLGVSGIFNRRRFGEGKRLTGDQVSIGTAYDTAAIPGFDDGVTMVELTGDLVLDYRDRHGFTSSGFYAEGFVGGAPPQGDFEYVHWGAELIGFINLYHRMRVLVLRAGMEAVDGAQHEIPFSELPRLGGPTALRGYKLDTFREKKSLFASAEYRWRIHQNVEVHAYVDAGEVAHRYGDLFDEDGWHFAGGGGISIGGDESRFLTFDVAYGDGLQIFVAAQLGAFMSRTEEL